MPAIDIQTEIPGPHSRELLARRQSAAPRGTPILTPVAIARGHGATVTDIDGNTFLDFAGGIGALATGHGPTGVVKAIQSQAGELIHMCAIVASYAPFVELCECLNAVTPGDFAKKTTLVNTGAEAVETAVKIARAYTRRPAVIVFEGAYHGRTNLTMAMTSKYSLFKMGFGPFAPEVYRLPVPNLFRRPSRQNEDDYLDACLAQLEHAFIAQIAPEAVAAVVIEPVQGEGGFVPIPPRFLGRLRELCTMHGIVFVADEVQCGFGRTGKLFAIEHYGIVPDLIVTGKSIAAGMPLAAVTGRAEIMDGPHPGGLGGTYSGNPLACVAALENIQTLASAEFLDRAIQVGERLRAHLEDLQRAHPSVVGDVRGIGPMLAIEIVDEQGRPDADTTAAINAGTLQRGLITIRAGLHANCIRLLPSLMISDGEIDEAMTVLRNVVDDIVNKR